MQLLLGPPCSEIYASSLQRMIWKKNSFCTGRLQFQLCKHPEDNTWQCLGGESLHQNMSTGRQFTPPHQTSRINVTALSRGNALHSSIFFFLFKQFKILRLSRNFAGKELITKSLGGFSHDYTRRIKRTIPTVVGMIIKD